MEILNMKKYYTLQDALAGKAQAKLARKTRNYDSAVKAKGKKAAAKSWVSTWSQTSQSGFGV